MASRLPGSPTSNVILCWIIKGAHFFGMLMMNWERVTSSWGFERGDAAAGRAVRGSRCQPWPWVRTKAVPQGQVCLLFSAESSYVCGSAAAGLAPKAVNKRGQYLFYTAFYVLHFISPFCPIFDIARAKPSSALVILQLRHHRWHQSETA